MLYDPRPDAGIEEIFFGLVINTFGWTEELDMLSRSPDRPIILAKNVKVDMVNYLGRLLTAIGFFDEDYPFIPEVME